MQRRLFITEQDEKINYFSVCKYWAWEKHWIRKKKSTENCERRRQALLSCHPFNRHFISSSHVFWIRQTLLISLKGQSKVHHGIKYLHCNIKIIIGNSIFVHFSLLLNPSFSFATLCSHWQAQHRQPSIKGFNRVQKKMCLISLLQLQNTPNMVSKKKNYFG